MEIYLINLLREEIGKDIKLQNYEETAIPTPTFYAFFLYQGRFDVLWEFC